MDLIFIILIGMLAGWLSGKIMKGRGFGLLGNLAVGIVGSFVGSVIFSAIGLIATGFIGKLICATVGAVTLIFAMRVISRT